MSYQSALAVAAHHGDDPDGSIARRQWHDLPARTTPADLRTTQAVPEAAQPEMRNELTHLIALASLA